MYLSRRGFLTRSAAATFMLATPYSPARATAIRETIAVNHLGFAPGAGKFCLMKGARAVDFSVVDIATDQPAFRGTLRPVSGDHGTYLVGEFSDLRQRGTYRIHSATAGSGRFDVADDVYEPAIGKCISYFARQRCGDSKMGFHAPCHLDDGRRNDNGEVQDATGGWHDACDVRKWVNATLYGMIGLGQLLDYSGEQRRRGMILEELRWGNQYFRKMQEPAGYLMNYCGGDDGNRWTDNRRRTGDDRRIHVEPCDLTSQFDFIAAEAAMARHTEKDDPDYSRGCAQAALRCLRWCIDKRPPKSALSLSAAVVAAVELHRAVGGDHDKLAATLLQQLIELQVTGEPASQVRGFFHAEPGDPQPLRTIMYGNLPLRALCSALEHLPHHPQAARWRERLALHTDFLVQMSQRSAFGTIPFGLYHGSDPGGGRQIGDYWYRWFMKPRDENRSSGSWWVGINAHLASNGIGLAKAYRLLKVPQLARLAQRQLDWILGFNPFDASTVTGVGRNQPRLFRADEFQPPTPHITGGVMNGLGGSANDEVVLSPGSYNTCEYWTPMTAYTMWLMAELQHKSPD